MFAKVFGQIFDSSISVDYVTRHVFMDLLVLADRDGAVDMTLEAIARRTNVPLEIITQAITELCTPDANSRSSSEDGRRLVLLDEHRDWGWRIVNYQQYRDIRDEEGRRAYFREYARQHRAKQRQQLSTPVKDNQHLLKKITEITHTDTDTDTDTDREELSFAELWKIWPRHESKTLCWQKYQTHTRGQPNGLILKRAKKQVELWQTQGTEKKFIPMLATWLNQKRYDTEPELIGGPNDGNKRNDIIDAIRNNRTMPDFGRGAVQTPKPVDH